MSKLRGLKKANPYIFCWACLLCYPALAEEVTCCYLECDKKNTRLVSYMNDDQEQNEDADTDFHYEESSTSQEKKTYPYRWVINDVNPIPKAKPTNIERSARISRPWLDQISYPYANQIKALDHLPNTLVGYIFDAEQDKTGSVNSQTIKKRIALYEHKGTEEATINLNQHIVKTPYDKLPEKSFSWSGLASKILWLNQKKATIVYALSDKSSPSNEAASALKKGINKNVLYITPSGDDGEGEPVGLATYANAQWSNNQILIVGSVTQENQLSEFSNAAGSLSPWYVVAPGENIVLGKTGEEVTMTNSTATAAQYVTSQAALLKKRWPHLTASQVAHIITQTATHLGDTPDGTVDPIYGWGIVNITKSLQPIGLLEVTLPDNNKVPVSILSLGNLQGAIGAAIRAAALRKELVIDGATDYFGRHFSFDLKNTLSQPAPKLSLPNFADYKNKLRYQDMALDAYGSQIRYTLKETILENPATFFLANNKREITTLNSVAWLKRFSDGTEVAASVGKENYYVGLSEFHIKGTSELNGTLNNTYFNLIPFSSTIGIGKSFNNQTKVKLSFSHTGLSQFLTNHANTYEYLPFQSRSGQNKLKASLYNIEIVRDFGSTVIGFGLSFLNEGSSLLGTQMGTGFNFNTPAKTKIFTINTAHKLADGIVMIGYLSYGVTQPFRNTASLISAVSTTYSQSYGMGFVVDNVWLRRDQLAIGLSSPLKVISGKATLDFPVSVDSSGNIIRRQKQISLVTPLREYRAEISYTTSLSKTDDVNFSLIYRLNADNDADKASDVLSAVVYRKSF